MIKSLDFYPSTIDDYIPEKDGDSVTIEYLHPTEKNEENVRLYLKKSTNGEYYISWARMNKKINKWQNTRSEGPLNSMEEIQRFWFMYQINPDDFLKL